MFCLFSRLIDGWCRFAHLAGVTLGEQELEEQLDTCLEAVELDYLLTRCCCCCLSSHRVPLEDCTGRLTLHSATQFKASHACPVSLLHMRSLPANKLLTKPLLHVWCVGARDGIRCRIGLRL